MDKPITYQLPADLPESWQLEETVSPTGTDVGLTEKHGYNYLNKQVNEAHKAINLLNESFVNVQSNLEGLEEASAIADGDSLPIVLADLTTKKRLTFTNYIAVIKQKLGTVYAPLVHSHGNITNDGKIGTVANRAAYTGTDGLLIVGTLPVAAGGTGRTTYTKDQVLIGGDNNAIVQRAIDTTAGGTTDSSNLITSGAVAAGLAGKLGINAQLNPDNFSKVVPVSKGGTGAATFTAGQVLLGNGTNAFMQRAIDTTEGGSLNSNSLITSGAVRAALDKKLGSTANAASATKLATARTIGLSGAATGTATSFNGEANITIPVTSLDATKLVGTASINTTGSAAKLTTPRTFRVSLSKTDYTNFDGSENVIIGVEGVLPIAKGGTGAATFAAANKNLLTAGQINMAPATDLPSGYGEGVVVYIEGPDSRLPYKPSAYGIMLSIKTLDNISQLWFTQPNGPIYHRGGNGVGWNGSAAVPTNRAWTPIGSAVANTVAEAQLAE